MKQKDFKDWHKKQEFENLLFFAQRLDELFFDYSLDTYKPPALNSVYLCREAIDLIQDIENDIIESANLEHVLNELKWSLSSDSVAKLMVKAPMEKFITYGKDIKLVDTRIRLEVLEKTLSANNYIATCQQVLIEEINGGSKKQIEKVTRVFASTLINMGVSKQHLYDKTLEFFFYGEEITSLDALESFFYLISPTSHNFEIYFLVSKLITEINESIDSFDLQIISDLPNDIMHLANNNDLVPTENEVWVEVKGIESFDRHSARKQAEARLDRLRNLFLLFSHKNRIEWKDVAIITQCCDETPMLIRRPKNSMEKCFDLRPYDASKRLNSMLGSLGLMDNSFLKFHQAVDLHAIGTTNDLPENQLLNIWIALETLVPSHVHGGGKVVKVSNGIMPILLKNYITRLIQRLSADLVRWDRAKISKILRELPNSKEKSLYRKVLELISLQSNQASLSKLYAELDKFYLLKFRVYEICELFKKPENLIKRIELHEKKVAWQIRRIYRTRNLIVHSGRSIPYIDSLIENGHDYLDQAINSILEYSCGLLDADTLEQAFDMAKLDYEVYLKEIHNITILDDTNLKLFVS
jgi:hypothetical protein